jgi:large subunit ribosomal protein L22
VPTFGVKTNEGARHGVHAPGERPGTRAVAKHVRMSAYKARVVLDLIRGKDVNEADAILQFTEREAAEVIRKALRSAVANAQNNEGIDPEVLYVSACFADEGTTIKRWRPRARGRATRIRKRTCHITVIVAAYTPEEQERRQVREVARGATGTRQTRSAAAARAARVARSKQAAPVVDEPTTDTAVAAEVDEELDAAPAVTEEAAETPDVDEELESAPDAAEETETVEDDATDTEDEDED